MSLPPAVASRSAARRGSYLEQLLTEHPRSAPEPTAPSTAPVAAAGPAGQPATTLAVPAGVPTAAAGVHTTAAIARTAAALTRARTRSSTDDDTEVAADAVETETADCIAACTRTAFSPLSSAHADWTTFGTVIPVLAGHPGGGASVLAAVLADAVAAHGHRVLLIDAADPLRSGLADATTDDGPRRAGPHRAVGIRQSERGPIRCARLEFTGVPVRSAGMVAAPQFWAVPDGPVDVTVVDIGWDAWALASQPLQGPGGWLRHGSPTPRPVVALRPTLPAARHTEQLLARLSAWTQGGGSAEIAAVAVMGAKKLPPALRAVAGHTLTPLLQDAVCLPEDRSIAERGVTSAPTPSAAQQAVLPLLTNWDLLGTNKPDASAAVPRGARRSLLRRKPERPTGDGA
jgi:hypothetical protein